MAGPVAAGAGGLSEAFRERLIRLRTMEPNLRRVAVATMAGIVVAGLLVAGRDVPLGRVVVGGTLLNHASVSEPVLLLCIALQVVAWSVLLAGGMHAHWPLRALVLLIWSAAMFAIPFSASVLPGKVTVLDVWATAAGVLLLVLTVWSFAVCVWVVDRFHPGWAQRTHRHRLVLATGLAGLVATALIYALGWLASPVPEGLDTAVALQLSYLSPFMIMVLIVTGSDFTEWAEVVAGRVGTVLARRRPQLPAVGAGLIALALVGFDVWRDPDPSDLVPSVLQVATMAGVGLALGPVLVSRPPTEIPPFTLIWAGLAALLPFITASMILDALTLVILPAAAVLLLTPLSGSVLGAGRVLGGFDTTSLPPHVFLGLQALVAPAAVALILIARRLGRLRLAAFFFALVAAGFLWEVGIEAALDHGNGVLFVSSMALGPALACLGLAVWSVAGRDRSPRRPALLRLLLVLALGMQLLSWLVDGFDAVSRYGEAFSLAQGAVLVAAMFWDLAMSGSAVTNRHGPRVPRHSRVLLYVGYTLLAASAVTFWTLLPAADVLAGSPEGWVREGLMLLGPPLLVAYFTFGVMRLRHPPREPALAERP
jgi:hypothetical protein